MPIPLNRRTTCKALTSLPWALSLTAKAQSPQAAHTLPAPAAHRLEALQGNPGLAGDRVYRADVHALDDPEAPPLYVYARHVQAIGSGLTASHLTYLPSGELIIEERVTTSGNHRFLRLDVSNRQTGLAGSVALDPDHNLLHFERSDSTQPKEERATAPVVAGPNLHGYILQHWDHLTKGEQLPIRMVVLARMETLAFTMKWVESTSKATRFQITPSHFLIRLVVSPLHVVFDNASRRVVRYEGRVPPMRNMGHRLVDLDAAVDYHWDADRYR
jgi:hypothetical protein